MSKPAGSKLRTIVGKIKYRWQRCRSTVHCGYPNGLARLALICNVSNAKAWIRNSCRNVRGHCKAEGWKGAASPRQRASIFYFPNPTAPPPPTNKTLLLNALCRCQSEQHPSPEAHGIVVVDRRKLTLFTPLGAEKCRSIVRKEFLNNIGKPAFMAHA